VKVISWNLLRRTGAAVRHVAALIDHERPDLLLMQEATNEMEALPSLAGGHFHRLPWASRIHGLAAWSPHPLAVPRSLPLPASRLPGRLPRRVSQIVQVDDMLFANVHLSHGQLLNRRQLARIAMALQGHPAAIIGDYNAVGPIVMSGFKDVGPRLATHFASNVVPFRLDRCLVRGLRCTEAHALEFGPSDHRPIVLHLEAELASARPVRLRIIDPDSAFGKRIARIKSRFQASR
jgi:endonuclease/exonuclease/phosphatase (EEP) superfamily protein YafD